MRRSGVWVVPCGRTARVLAWARLRGGVGELEGGETVLGVVAGETGGVAGDVAGTGGAGGTPLVVVKPLEYDVTGHYEGDYTIALTGTRQVYNRCRPTRRPAFDELIFDYNGPCRSFPGPPGSFQQ